MVKPQYARQKGLHLNGLLVHIVLQKCFLKCFLNFFSTQVVHVGVLKMSNSLLIEVIILSICVSTTSHKMCMILFILFFYLTENKLQLM